MKKLLQDRKTLYLVLSIVMISVFTLSIAYAAMSAVLEIHGNSEVVASSWDIHLDNVEVKSGSVSANTPSISGTSSLSFDVELNTPGDYYEFTVDVVNDGSIDAMIDSVVKTPELTPEQAKYIKYEITYANGESISTKQTLKRGTTTPIKVQVGYRKDLVAGDLPSSATELSLKLTLVYVQSDGTGSSIPNNGGSVVNIVSGDGTNVGDEVCIKDECFYVISSTDDTVTMLAKYNLNVGQKVLSYDVSTGNKEVSEIVSPTSIQDANSRGRLFDSDENHVFPWIGSLNFAKKINWGNITNYPSYVYDSNSSLYTYIENYDAYLSSLGVNVDESRLISWDELENLGCTYSGSYSCIKAPIWIYSSSYWTGVAHSYSYILYVSSRGKIAPIVYENDVYAGVRPVITISRNYL